MTKKIEKVPLITLLSILIIIISVIALTCIKFENSKKKYNQELINNDLCSRKTFSGQLKYLANEQAVFYNLDNNNIYKDTIGISQNKFKEYMESKGWKYDVERSTDYASEIVEVELMKNNVTVFFQAQEDFGIERYYEISSLFVEDEKERTISSYSEDSIVLLDIKVGDLEKIKINYSDHEEMNILIEKTFKEFITDVQNYSEEICSSSSEDRLEL